MFRSIREVMRRRSSEALNGIAGKRIVTSWMSVFRAEVDAQIPHDENTLCDLMQKGQYSCIGKSHSYNGVQLAPGTNAMMMREGGLKWLEYREKSETVVVGASVSVEELKRFLLKHKRRMVNSGNYMAQTVIGALITGTHGYGKGPVMADGVVRLVFLNDSGERVELKKGHPDFDYVVLSFGVIAPVIEVELKTEALQRYTSDAYITRLSKKDSLTQGAEAVSWACAPYSDPSDPMVMVHALRPLEGEAQPAKTKGPRLFSLSFIVEWLIRQLWLMDRVFPSFRRKLQRFAYRLKIEKHQHKTTAEDDLDYLYDPDPGLKRDRGPDLLTGFFATTHTAYNLAFFVPLDRQEAVVRFIMLEVENYRDLGFYLKSMIGIRELRGTSDLPFAGTHHGPVAAIDIFSDPRDYAWLERLQREVIAYEPRTRPHFGKSALVPEYREVLGKQHLRKLFKIHMRHFPNQRLMFSEPVRRLLDIGKALPGTSAADAQLAADMEEIETRA